MMNIRDLDFPYREAIVDTLVAAFDNYPAMNYFVGDIGEDYPRVLRLLNEYFTDARLLRNWPVHGITDGSEVLAVTIVSQPLDGDAPPLPDLVSRVRGAVGEGVWKRLKDFDRKSDTTMPDGPHHFIGMLATHPDHQGKGLGTALVNHIKQASIDEGSLGVTLSTETESNVEYYRHLGFEVSGQMILGGITSWGMVWRNPER